MPRFRYAASLLALALAPAVACARPPKSWIDPRTGHRVIRVTNEPGSGSLYFNLNAYTPDGREMIYSTADHGIGVVDLANFGSHLLVEGPVVGPDLIQVGRKTGRVYFMTGTSDPQRKELWSVDIGGQNLRKIALLPRRGVVGSFNADETLAAGTYVIGGGEDYGERRFGHRRESKSEAMAEQLAAHLPMAVFTVDLNTGKTRTLFTSTDWIDHLQFSPTDPNLLMYAHQGAWNQVDKLWLVRIDHPTQPVEIGRRIMLLQGIGHQWWDTQDDIWYDQHFPLGGDVSYIVGWNVPTSQQTWYHYQPDEASIHFNRSPDGTLFCGDGGPEPGGQWIYLFRPVLYRDNHTPGQNLIRPGIFRAERLVDMSKQNYRQEPNVRFTPDAKWVIFRSNMFGSSYVFAVEVAKAPSAL